MIRFVLSCSGGWCILFGAGAVAKPVPATIFGAWVGESRCLGTQPSCHDEHVVYRIDSAGARSAVMHGSRVVGRDTVDMGDLPCSRAALAITCTIPAGTWRFWLDGPALAGSLTRADRAVLRQVTAHRPARG